jgi:BCD family chlorophyll transporter-like MFS transporter
MLLLKNIRLGLLHASVAVVLVPITGVLNRIMINELGMLATLVSALIILPYLLAPLQVWIGHISDTHPLWGYRRTPYIAAGLGLCIGGAVLTPHAALLMADNMTLGLLLAVLVFGVWGVGFNVAAVSYLSLASDLSPEGQRSRTIATMWFMMIGAVIITAIVTGNALEPYSDAQLIRVFQATGLVALLLSAMGLIGLEPRTAHTVPSPSLLPRHSQRATIQTIAGNRQARLFFCYLILLLSAILGQDVLLEPFGAQAFGMSVRQTAHLTAIWGGMTLLALLLHGALLSRWLGNKTGAAIGSMIAAGGLLVIAASGVLGMEPLFIPGLAALGFGTGISTATNLALMLDMTTPEQVGLFIGAWGVADALARATGSLLGGAVRDVITQTTGNATSGYLSVFLIEALLLGVSLLLLRHMDIAAFRRQQPSLTEVIAVAGDV